MARKTCKCAIVYEHLQRQLQNAKSYAEQGAPNLPFARHRLTDVRANLPLLEAVCGLDNVETAEGAVNEAIDVIDHPEQQAMMKYRSIPQMVAVCADSALTELYAYLQDCAGKIRWEGLT